MRILYLFLLGLIVMTSLQAVGMFGPSDEEGKDKSLQRPLCKPEQTTKMPYLFY